MISPLQRIATSLIIILLTGCSLGPNYYRPHLATLPSQYSVTRFSSKPSLTATTAFGQTQKFVPNQDIPTQWWKFFHSQSLNRLIQASLKHNPDIAAAQSALATALANSYAQKGLSYPSINASFSGAPQQTAAILQSTLANNKYNFSLYTGQILIAYTLDIFGSMHRQLESLIAKAEFQRLQLKATYPTLTTNVANAAIQAAGLEEKILVTQNSIHNQAEIVAIYQQQLKLGQASIADLAIQKAVLATVQGTLPPLEHQLFLQYSLLKALTGQLPDSKPKLKLTLSALTLPQALPLSCPSQLLEQRPDIRAAEEQMRAANALIGVAIANRLPNVTLSSIGTNLGFTSTNISHLLTTGTHFWSLAGLITQPIFDAGSLGHRQAAAYAVYEQTVAQYRATVINAFQNVANTLDSIESDSTALQAASKAERATLKSLKISRSQLELGDDSILSLLINQQLYYQNRLNLIQAQVNRLLDTVAFFQALGGGWTSSGYLNRS